MFTHSFSGFRKEKSLDCVARMRVIDHLFMSKRKEPLEPVTASVTIDGKEYTYTLKQVVSTVMLHQ